MKKKMMMMMTIVAYICKNCLQITLTESWQCYSSGSINILSKIAKY